MIHPLITLFSRLLRGDDPAATNQPGFPIWPPFYRLILPPNSSMYKPIGIGLINACWSDSRNADLDRKSPRSVRSLMLRTHLSCRRAGSTVFLSSCGKWARSDGKELC